MSVTVKRKEPVGQGIPQLKCRGEFSDPEGNVFAVDEMRFAGTGDGRLTCYVTAEHTGQRIPRPDPIEHVRWEKKLSTSTEERAIVCAPAGTDDEFIFDFHSHGRNVCSNIPRHELIPFCAAIIEMAKQNP